MNYPGGTIKESFYEYLVRTLGEFKHIDEIGQIPLRTENLKNAKLPRYAQTNDDPSNRLILLKDVATVTRTVKERTSFSRYNGLENVTISIQKQASANTIKVTGAIKKKLKELKADLPKDIEIDVIYDQSKFINDALDGVKDAALQGGLLAFLVLVIFLKDFVNSGLVVTITPVTVLATYTLMYFMGISLNVISLGGVALGVGMLLDNAVVVIENVYRKFREKPEDGMEKAAIVGSEEVMAPMIASTLTTVSVFLPIVFVTGIAGQIFKELAWVVVVTQVISAIIAFTLLPMLIAKVGGRSALTRRDIHDSGSGTQGPLGGLIDLLGTPIRAIESAYASVLPAFIRRKWFYLSIVLGVFAFCVAMLASMEQ
ncbi:MAG: efflux RND transporter permease subunit, partial [Micavibrio sp.]|nr:efflux RND transporter permease subunit [Micavibrio sp.]